MKKKLFAISTLVATLIATQVLAASGEACLQRNRLQSWRAVDESTMVMTDIQQNQYTVQTEGPLLEPSPSRGSARLLAPGRTFRASVRATSSR